MRWVSIRRLRNQMVASQKARVNAVIAREPKRPWQSPNQIAASPPASRNDVYINKMYSMHGVIGILHQMVHDYMEDLNILTSAIQTAHEFVATLTNTTQKLHAEIQKRGWVNGNISITPCNSKACAGLGSALQGRVNTSL